MKQSRKMSRQEKRRRLVNAIAEATEAMPKAKPGDWGYIISAALKANGLSVQGLANRSPDQFPAEADEKEGE